MNPWSHTDRLVVERQVEGFAVAPSGSICVAQDGDLIIATPPDIVSIRNTDRATAARLRLERRASFETAFANSFSIQGLTHNGSFIMVR